MASGGGSDRHTGTVPKSKARNNCNVPQEVVTPTRRDMHSTNMMNASVDWLPVSEQNSRSSQNRARKPTNIQTDNDYVDLDSSTTHEGSSRFVPVRPQPRTLVLRQRDSLMDNSEDSSSYNSILGGHSPHTSHTAIMIVNPTTPNSNQTNQNMNSGSSSRNNVRGASLGRESSYSNNAVPICPHPVNNNNSKPTNVSNDAHETIFQNGTHQNYNHDNATHNQQSDHTLPRTEAARAIGENLVAACPETARVEQRLGQIREYIRVTSTLVESMRNSEDELRKRLTSLRHCNDMLIAGVCKDDEQNVEEPDSDMQELIDTLHNLRDSEQKLEGMLQYLDVKETNNEIAAEESIEIKDLPMDVSPDVLPQNSVQKDSLDGNESDQHSPITVDVRQPIENENSIVNDWLNKSRNVTEAEGVTIEEIKNDEKEQADSLNKEAVARPTSAQSSGSAYSESDLWQSELKTNMEITQLRLAAAIQEQKRLLKYQAEAKEQLAEMHMARNAEAAGGLHNDLNHQDSSGNPSYPNTHQPLAINQNAGRVYGTNQIGVATTLLHVSDNNQHNNNVAKIQNLHVVTSSLADAMSCPTAGEPSLAEGRSSAAWGGSEGSEEDGGNIESTIRNKAAAVNVMKVELERLKNMLRTVDSIQNNFGINSTFEEDNLYDNSNSQAQLDNQLRNRNRLSESSVSNNPLCRTDSSSSAKVQGAAQSTGAISKNQNTPLGLSRLQNCISSGSNKCTNVSEQNIGAGDNVGSGLAAIQQLTQELKQAAQGLSDERRRLKHATNRDICTSSGSSIKSEEKKKRNSGGAGVPGYPAYPGPVERKQLVLKAELEAKKKQLERLMSKDVDHRTNQQPSAMETESPSKATASGADETPLPLPTPNAPLAPPAGPEDDCNCQVMTIRTDIDNGYSSDQDEDEDASYVLSSRNQLNINEMSAGPSHKLPSRSSSPGNFKDASYFGDSTQSLDGSYISQNIKRNKLQQRVNLTVAGGPSGGKQHNREPLHSGLGLRDMGAKEGFPARSDAREVSQESRALPEISITPDREAIRRASQLLSRTPAVGSANSPGRNKDPCDVSNVSNASSSSSGGDRDPVPPPMTALPPRHHSRPGKNNRDNSNPENSPPQWHNPHSESQVTMWWHNKANQLQQQLEMTSNLCQSLLQDRRAGQTSPLTFNSSSQTTTVPNSMLIPNYSNNSMVLPNLTTNPMVVPNFNPMMFPNYQNNSMFMPMHANVQLPNHPVGGMPFSNYPSSGMMLPNMSNPGLGVSEPGAQMWALQQQATAAAWGSAQCIQHLLSQQREISMLRNNVTNLEEKMHALNNVPRAHSTPPNLNFADNAAHPQVMRANSAQSNSQLHSWNIQNLASNSHSEVGSTVNPSSYSVQLSQPGMHAANLYQNRMTTSKVTPNVTPFSGDHPNNQLPANFALSSNIFHNEQTNEQINLPMASHSNVSMMNQPLFNNCAPPAQLNPNVLSNQSIPQPIQNNRNPNCLLNLTPHVAMNNPHPIGVSLAATQTLTGQSTALNNQVPPGNRANNYWDNFRSYSRQNLLSGTSKTNADPAFPTHSPHPLVERSHNTLHSGTPPGSSSAAQAANTPKRNVNTATATHNTQADTINDATHRRGRRNLSQDSACFTAPPDVLNVNQNLDLEPNQMSSNILNSEEPSSLNRFHSSFNVNLNRSSTNPIPEIIQAHSNNLNVPRSNGAHKKKSSSKLPAKNASNAGNYSLDYAHNRIFETNTASGVSNPNLASTSSANTREKSTTKLFDLLRENVYSEVTALISANESRPHFLIQLFRDLQQISSDTLRQRALQSIQELISHYLSAVETESYEASDDHRNLQRDSSINENQVSDTTSLSNETAILALDIDNEILRFILSHHSDICSNELLEALQIVVMSSIGNQSNHSYIDQSLRDSLSKYQGCKLMDIRDDLMITISRILSSVDANNHHNTNSVSEILNEAIEITHATEQRAGAISPYQENASSERHFTPHTIENSAIDLSGNQAEGPSCSSMLGNEASGVSHTPQLSHEASNRFVGMPESKIDLIESVETYNGDLAEADQSRHGSETAATSADGALEGFLPDVVDTEEQTPTEAEAEWLGLDRVPTRLQMDDNPGNQSGMY